MKKAQNKFNTLRRFFSYYKPHKKLFIADTVCALFVALCNLFYPTIAKSIINDYVPNQNMRLLIVWGVTLLVLYVIKALFTYFIQSWGHILGVRIQGDMRKDMFRHLQTLPYSYFDAHKTGAIMSGIVNDLYEVGELAHHGPEDFLLSTITIVGAFIMLISVNVYLTLIVFCVLPLIAIFASYSKKKMREAFADMREQTAKVNADVSTAISGVRVTKAYVAEQYAQERFDEVNERFKVARGSAYKAMGIFYAGMGFISDFLYVLVLIIGGIFYYYSLIDTGEFAAYILYIVMLINPIKSLVSIYEQIQSGMTGFSRFCKVLAEPCEKDTEGACDKDEVIGDIKFENVDFSYNQETSVLHNLSFEVPHGKTTALVGGSGGGKTTVCHLLMRFYEPDSGRITVDGVNIRELTYKSLRTHFGIVAQDVFIFDGTIRENIAFGKLDASEEEIVNAAKEAGIHEYIMSLEGAYDAFVGERGVKLSGGQRQRISIARAFLKNPEILILDEATSSLDNITERQIQSALERLSSGRTVFVVAHRLSTIENADKIIVMEHGQVVEQGTHETLLEANGRYKEMLTVKK